MVGASLAMLTLSSDPLWTLPTGQPCWSPSQSIHKGSSWRALLRRCTVVAATLTLFYIFYSHVVSMVTHHPPEPTEPGKRQDYIPEQQGLSCTGDT